MDSESLGGGGGWGPGGGAKRNSGAGKCNCALKYFFRCFFIKSFKNVSTKGEGEFPTQLVIVATFGGTT